MWLKSFSAVLLLLLIGCDAGLYREKNLLSYIPDEASIIIKINNLNTFQSELKNNNFLNDAGRTETAKRIKSTFKILGEIQADTTSIIALFESDTTHLLYVSHARSNWFRYTDSTDFNTSYKNGIQNIEIDGLKLYASILDGNRVASTSIELLDKAVSNSRKRNSDDPLEILYRTTSPQKSASFFINTKRPSTVFPSIFKRDLDENEFVFSDWITFDLNSGQQYLYLNGLAQIKDTTHNFLKLFEGTRALTAVTPDLAPPDTDALLIYTFDDYEKFAQNQQEYLDSPYSINTPFNTVEEIGHIYQKGNRAVLVSAFASEAIQNFLDGISNERRDYQGHEIRRLSMSSFLEEAFKPLVEEFKANFYCILDDKYVFSESSTFLESIIANRNSGTSFKNSQSFQSAEENLTNKSNILFLANHEGLKSAGVSFLSKDLFQEISQSPTGNYIFSSQIASDHNFFHTHISVNKQNAHTRADIISPLFSIELDHEITSDPQFVINHRTNKKEIVVQDMENNLYLISTEGKVLWKKELDAPVKGKISQVDIYKNGRLQLAFTTSNQFLILDRNGKEVPPFNKSYPGGNLNPLAVFDYENNKNYRFVVTQGPEVFMYNPQGNIVGGFKYTEAESPILDAPKHIRIGQRDYLVFKLENGTLKILNRVGNDRITISESIQFSENEVYLYRDKFVLTDKQGTLYSIDSEGKVSKSDLNFKEDHRIDATSKTLVTLNESTLNIKGRGRDLELGVYLRPVIFYIYDKIYVATTDIQSGQVYLFDSSNKAISNFPVYGNSVADLEDMDNDGRLEMVTKDQDNSLIVYSLR